MAVVAHVYPEWDLLEGTKAITGTLSGATNCYVLLVHSTSPAYTWNSTSEGHEFVTNFLAGSGAGALTEETGTGYSRQALSSVSLVASGTVVTLTCSNPSWTTATISATYAAFYQGVASSGSDSTNQLILYWDFGGTFAVTAGTFTLTISGSGLATWTSS